MRLLLAIIYRDVIYVEGRKTLGKSWEAKHQRADACNQSIETIIPSLHSFIIYLVTSAIQKLLEIIWGCSLQISTTLS
jgi:hypothetical protein